MSEEKLQAEAKRWYRQASDDLEAAQVLFTSSKYAQAGFYAQQVAEKAMKAVWTLLDLDPCGYSASRLIRELPESRKAEFNPFLEGALHLDKLYISTRYPELRRTLSVKLKWLYSMPAACWNE